MSSDQAFEIEIEDDGAVRISGEWGASTLMTIVLAAKFGVEPRVDILLSPHVNRMVAELSKVVPIAPIDWSNPAILTPQAFVQSVNVIRAFRDMHEPDRNLEELVAEALMPFVVPPDRLGLESPGAENGV